jgi:cystathionine beta-lyase
MTVKLPFDAAIDLDQLKKRTSEKWRHYPAEVLPVFVAESDFPLAEPIAQRLRTALDDGDVGYAVGDGLGEAYASFARVRYGLEVDPNDVAAVPEVMVGVAEILRALGDGAVIINSPVYPPFFSTIEEVRWPIADAPLRRDGQRFNLDFNAIEARMSEGARVMLFCNPHNPVGRVYTKHGLRELAALAKRYDTLVLCDEIHAPLMMPGIEFTPFAAIAEEADIPAITLTSASKGWNIAGLKCAIAVASGDSARRILRRLPKAMAERSGHLGVHATIAAFTEGIPYLDTVVKHLDGMRSQLRSIFDSAGLEAIEFTPPEAGYLAWLDCTKLGLERPAATFYKEGKVALVPGEHFGKDYNQWARFNFATSTAIVAEAARRIASAL